MKIQIEDVVIGGCSRVVKTVLQVISHFEIVFPTHPVIDIVGQRSVDLKASAKLIKPQIDRIQYLTGRQFFSRRIVVLDLQRESQMDKTYPGVKQHIRFKNRIPCGLKNVRNIIFDPGGVRSNESATKIHGAAVGFEVPVAAP